MTTLVSDKIKQLLFNNGWKYELKSDSLGRITNSLAEQRWNEGDLSYVDITIAEVVMWLYENYGIWVGITKKHFDKFTVIICPNGKYSFTKGITFENKEYRSNQYYETPIEAYEDAIEYCLMNNDLTK